ncbi:alanine racemase, partial [Patescibacteria group bacterium]|nr:alanine racemase [Patescibacteria group bacterium]
MKEKTWIEINSVSLEHNIHALGSLLGPQARFCAVVKSGAYGHGIEQITRLSKVFGINCFAVDSLEEAGQVKSQAPDADIFILGFTPPEKYPDVVEGGYIQTVYQNSSLEELSRIALHVRKQARVNIKIETGTNRQGVDLSELYSMLRTLKQYEREIEFTGISSHFADSENPASLMTENQNSIFQEALSMLESSGMNVKYRHIACSAAGILKTDTQYDLVRFGISLYGLWSSEQVKSVQVVRQNAIDLKPVLSWKTQIAQVKDVTKGDFVGYGLRFRADRPMRIAVLPVGYYDGYRRSASGNAFVLLRGHKCKVIGTICMNMMMIDVSQLPSIVVGDEVVLIGKQGMHQISVEDFAQWNNTINYEVVATLGSHIPR